MASIYDKTILSRSDLESLEGLTEAWQKTDDEEQKKQLHAGAEAIRNSYGYSGGDDGHGFTVTDSAVFSQAMAGGNYVGALEQAAKAEASSYGAQANAIEKSGEDRLREAYIKNMQDSLGLGQQLRAAGITGGATESTVAYMNNVYNSSRNDIIADTQEAKNELMQTAAQAQADSAAEIAKAELESAGDRAQAVKDAEQTAYDRAQDAQQLEYQKQKDEREYDYRDRELEYQKQKDERDFQYQKQSDEYDRAQEAKKASASGSSTSSSSSGGSKLTAATALSLIKAGAYSPQFAGVLGISDAEVQQMVKSYTDAEKREMAWKLLAQGIYDDSFPELLGYSEDTLINYANSYLMGY